MPTGTASRVPGVAATVARSAAYAASTVAPVPAPAAGAGGQTTMASAGGPVSLAEFVRVAAAGGGGSVQGAGGSVQRSGGSVQGLGGSGGSGQIYGDAGEPPEGGQLAVQAFPADGLNGPVGPSGAGGAASAYDQVVMRLAASGLPVVAREEAASSPSEQPSGVAQEERAAAVPAAGNGATGAAKQDQELVGRLFEPLLRRLRAELWLERERRGDLADPGGRRF
ncbi:hypothetical protein J5X84_12380 [Streptosporangiaceae bacterium NEAU-GS5]|nr:hypothetical protein [Streptosporangiaceae bacterium NEAU-GS5]